MTEEEYKYKIKMLNNYKYTCLFLAIFFLCFSLGGYIAFALIGIVFHFQQLWTKHKYDSNDK